MEIPNDVASHPLMQQVIAEVQKSREDKALEMRMAEGEALRLRHVAAQEFKGSFESHVSEYEAARQDINRILGNIFLANSQYERLTGNPTPGFHSAIFRRIHLPTLKPSANDWSSPVATTEMSVQAFFSNRGRWPDKV